MAREFALVDALRRSAWLALAAGCANVEAPPGTGPDFDPPAVVERFPAPGAIIPDLDDDAWIRFDEPIQSPRNLERGLDLSPAWDWRFNPRISGFSVRPREGWRPDVVYRIRIPPGVSDLIRNRTRRVIEWTFSTGPEISETRIDGIVYDRVTVSGVRDVRLLFLSADSVPYTAVSDTGGVYGMRSLPPAEYTVYAFQDQNRNRQLDRSTEPWDSASVNLPEPNSRYAVDLWILPPDSTPPRLLSVVAFDTITLSLEFDEPLDPEASLDGAVVSVTGPTGRGQIPVSGMQVGQPGVVLRDDPGAEIESDTTAIGEEEVDPEGILPTPEDEALAPPPVDSVGLESPAVDSLVADSLEADSVALPEPEAGGRERLQSAELRPTPFRTLVVRLEQALTEDTFRVSASGIPNLRGLAGGGDTTFVYVAPLAPVAPEAEPDTTGGVDPVRGVTLPPDGGEAPERRQDETLDVADPEAVIRDSAAVSSPERPPRSSGPRSRTSGGG